jgi:glutamate/aspartate transport system substrate-binding protein
MTKADPNDRSARVLQRTVDPLTVRFGRISLGRLIFGSHWLRCAAGLLLCTLLALSASTQVQADTLDDMVRSGTVRLGYEEQIPFSYAPYKGAVDGYTVEICQKVMASLRDELQYPTLKVVFVEITNGNLQGSLNTGRIDLACSATTSAQASRLGLSSSLPVYFASTQLMIPGAETIRNLSDQAGKRIAVVGGSPQEQLLQSQNNRYKIVSVPDMGAAFASAKSGRVDAVLAHDVGLQVQQKLDASPLKWQIQNKTVTVDAISIVMRANEPRLKKITDAVIRRMMLSDDILELHKKWFMSPLLVLSTPLNLRMSPLMRAHIRSPSEYVPTP